MRAPIEIGYELLSQGRHADALPFLQRAVAEMPKEARAHLYLALAYAQLGDTAQAEKHFARAIALNPHDAYVFYNWGAYLHRQGRLADALKAYETAYRLDPTLIGARQAADSLRGAAYSSTPAVPSAPTPPSPSHPAPTSSVPPPVQPTDLYAPAASRYRRARPWIVAGLVVSAIGLCIPIVGFLGGTVCGAMAMVRGSLAGGLVVIAAAFVLGVIGMLFWGLVQAMMGGVLPL